MKKMKMISTLISLAMLLSTFSVPVLSSGDADYEAFIYANGDSGFYLGTAPGYTSGATTFSSTVSPLQNGVSASVGTNDRTYGMTYGYGKDAGDNIYRYTKLEWYGDFQLICFGHGTPDVDRDQVGEFNYRLEADQAIKVSTNRWYNEEFNQIVIPRTDNLWHHLTYAYNSAIHKTTVWIDGEYFSEMTGRSAGLWVLTTAWLCDEDFIEIDDVKVWTLKPEASAITSGSGDDIVYESYNRIVSEKLENVRFSDITGEDFIISSNSSSVKVTNSPTCADVIYEAENNEGISSAKVLSADYKTVLADGEDAAGGNLVVSKTTASGGKVLKYYKILDDSGDYEYQSEIYTDGLNYYMGSSQHTNSPNWASSGNPFNCGTSVAVGNDTPGYGKSTGDNIIRFSSDGIPSSYYQYLVFGHGVPGTSGDQVGEFNYRNGSGKPIWITTNRTYNNENGTLLTIPCVDNLWHHLTFAYNSLTYETTFWIDGEYFNKITFPSAGLWVLSSSAIPEGVTIEFDDLKVYTLTQATSGQTHLNENNQTVYDSYNYIVNNHLDNTAQYEIANTASVISCNDTIVRVSLGTTCETLLSEILTDSTVDNAKMLSRDGSEELSGNMTAAGGLLAVTKKNKNNIDVIKYYTVFDPLSGYEYQNTIYGDGQNYYFGTALGNQNGAESWSSTNNPFNCGSSAQVSASVPGYGKPAGDKIFKFTNAGIPGGWYQFICFGNGVAGTSGDMVGEFNYRLGSGQNIWILANRTYNGTTSDSNIITLSYTDDLWHHLTFAYNCITHETTFWVDGEYYNRLVFPSAGLWVVSSAAITEGKSIEFDDIKAWTLTEATSGWTHEDENNQIVYDSYNYIVNDKLDNSFRASPIEGEIIASVTSTAIKVIEGATCNDVISEIEQNNILNAQIIDVTTGLSCDDNDAAIGKVLAVSKNDKNECAVITYYNILNASVLYEYQNEIHADGSNDYYMGSAPGHSDVPNWSTANNPFNSGYSATVGAQLPGYGKKDGDKLMRYTSDGVLGMWYQFLCFGNGVAGTSGDMVGEFDYRLGSGQNVWITGNRSYNGVQCSDIVVLPYQDDLWHHLSFAYNSVTHITTFWIDGNLHGTLNFPSAGLWVVSSAAIPSGKAIELDNLKGWTLTEETSGRTHTDESGNTIYDSYNFIIGDKLNLTMPVLSQPDSSNIIVRDNEIAIVGDVSVNTICSLGEDVCVINSNGTSVTNMNDLLTDEMYVVVTDAGKLKTYSVGIYNEGNGIWYSNLKNTNGSYSVKIINISSADISVIGYARNTVSGSVYASLPTTVTVNGECTLPLGTASESKIKFFIWNNNLMPFCMPFEN